MEDVETRWTWWMEVWSGVLLVEGDGSGGGGGWRCVWRGGRFSLIIPPLPLSSPAWLSLTPSSLFSLNFYLRVHLYFFCALPSPFSIYIFSLLCFPLISFFPSRSMPLYHPPIMSSSILSYFFVPNHFCIPSLAPPLSHVSSL